MAALMLSAPGSAWTRSSRSITGASGVPGQGWCADGSANRLRGLSASRPCRDQLLRAGDPLRVTTCDVTMPDSRRHNAGQRDRSMWRSRRSQSGAQMEMLVVHRRAQMIRHGHAPSRCTEAVIARPQSGRGDPDKPAPPGLLRPLRALAMTRESRECVVARVRCHRRWIQPSLPGLIRQPGERRTDTGCAGRADRVRA
jgi:hypothetical protein